MTPPREPLIIPVDLGDWRPSEAQLDALAKLKAHDVLWNGDITYREYWQLKRLGLFCEHKRDALGMEHSMLALGRAVLEHFRSKP